MMEDTKKFNENFSGVERNYRLRVYRVLYNKECKDFNNKKQNILSMGSSCQGNGDDER